MALKIALVEDDSSIRAMLEYYFKSLGHEIAAFESGEDFFAASPKADLALLDVMLPGMTAGDSPPPPGRSGDRQAAHHYAHRPPERDGQGGWAGRRGGRLYHQTFRRHGAPGPG